MLLRTLLAGRFFFTMSAADLFRAGQQMLQDNFPAVVEINGTEFRGATSGLRRGMVLADGGAEISRAVSFWIPIQAFISAGQPVPREQERVMWNGAEYLVETVTIDPARINVTLACVEQPQ